MQIRFESELVTKRPSADRTAPWLKGRGPRWQLTKDFVVVVIYRDGFEEVVVVPIGYIFDGSSIPRILWWMFPPSYGPAWRAAAVHDFIYSHLYRVHGKAFADEVFKAIMLEDGARPVVAETFYQMVKVFGKGGW